MTLKEKERRLNFITAVLIFGFFISMVAMPAVHADYAEDATQEDPFLLYMSETIVNGVNQPVIDTINGTGYAGKFYTFVVGGGIDGDTVSTFYEGIITGLKAAAGVLAVIYAASDLIMDMARGHEPAMEIMEKYAFQLFLLMLVLVYIDDIMDYTFQLGGAFLDLFANEGAKGGELTAIKLLRLMNNGNPTQVSGICAVIYTFIPVFAKLAIPYMIGFISNVLIYVVLLSTILELAVRKIFMPLAILDIYRDGLRSRGMMYVKKIIAIFLKIGVAIITVGISSKLMQWSGEALSEGAVGGLASFGGAMAYVMFVSAVGVMQIAMIMQGGAIANDAVGAQ